MSTKITEIIDQKAFEQWEAFVESLVTAQGEMAGLVKVTGGLSEELSKSNSFKGLNEGVKNLNAQLDALSDMQKKVISTEKNLENAQKNLIKQTQKRASDLEKEAKLLEEQKRKQEQSAKSMDDFKKKLQDVGNQSEATRKAYEELSSNSEKAIMRAVELKKEIKDLTKGFKENADSLTLQEQADYEKQMALMKDELREVNKEVRNYAKEMNASNDTMKSSLTPYQELSREVTEAKNKAKDLGAELITLRRSGEGTEEEIRELELAFNSANIKASALDAQIKALDKGMGDHQREVGNYALANMDASGSVNVLGTNIGLLSNSMQTQLQMGMRLVEVIMSHIVAEKARAKATHGATVATNASSKALDVLKYKLIATGIGAMVVLIGTLASAFLSTQRGADYLTRSLEPLKAVMDSLWGVAQDIATGLVDAFKNPTEAVKDLGKAILDNIINRFKAVGVILQGIANRDFKQISNGVAQAVTGVEDLNGKLEKGVEWVKEQAKVGAEIAESKIAISKLETEIEGKTKANSLEMERQREISKDTSLTYAERAKASEKIVEISKRQSALETEILEKKIEQLELQQSLNDTSREDEAELNALIAERDAIQQKHQMNVNKELRVTAGLKKEQVAQAKQLADEEKKRIDSIKEINRTEIEQVKFLMNEKLKELKLDKDKSKLTKAELDARTKIEQEASNKIMKIRNDEAKKLFDIAIEKRQMEADEVGRRADAFMEVADNESISLQERLHSVQDFFADKQKFIDLDHQIELEKIKRQREDAELLLLDGKEEEYNALISLIDAKENEIAELTAKKQEELTDKVKAKAFSLMQERYEDEKDWSLIFLEQKHLDEVALLTKQRGDGLISEEEYLKKRHDLIKQYEDEALKIQISQTEKIIQAAKKKGINVGELEKQLAKMKIEQSKRALDAQIGDIEDLEAREEEAKEKIKELTKELGDAILDMVSTVQERRIEDIERKIEENEEERERELARVENSTLSEEEKESQKLAIESKYNALQEDLDKKKREQQKKQARFEKAQAVASIIQSTAIGVAKALAQFPFPFNIAISALMGTLGAVALGKALSTKLPEYYTGTNSSEEGFAKVGERGQELGITPDGQVFLTPPKETITYLQKGTKIFNAQETKRMLAESGGKGGTEIAVLEMGALVTEQRRSTAELKKAFRENSSRLNITKEGWRIQHGKNSKLRKYLKRNGIRWMD